MDEFSAILKAREFVKKVNPTKIPVPVELYAQAIEARIDYDDSMTADEAGCSIPMGNKLVICVNGNDRPERQRFTICHEVAHTVLGLPSEHGESQWWSYAKRPPNEIICDSFAAELLLPYPLFKPEVESADIGFAAIARLAKDFEASLTATGSRFAAFSRCPCAFILAQEGKVRYTIRSTPLRDARAWIALGTGLPSESLAARLRASDDCTGPEEVPADIWFDDWRRGGQLLEDARYYAPWDQTISLIWFEDEEVPHTPRKGGREEEEESGLPELDGVLPWPGKKRRR
jgi:Zn-dependent peptidase ImmA (M78 family)